MADRPNLLLLLSDDEPFHVMDPKPGYPLGDPDPSHYWFPKTRTALGPGLTFQRAYVASPLCEPSRASLLTGLYPHNNGILTNSHGAPMFRKMGLQEREIGYWLKFFAGYRTGFFGKYLNHFEDMGGWVPPGWDRFVGIHVNRNPVRGNVFGKVKRPRNAQKNFIARKNETRWLADKALEFIASDHGGMPWFCVASVSSPHSPYSPPDAHANAFSGVTMPERENFNYRGDPNKPKGVRDEPGIGAEALSEIRADWKGMMRERADLDDQVERFGAAVDFEETYVFYLSDNGFMLGEFGCRKKARVYEESSRTPLMVRGPGVVEGAQTDALVSSVDVPATVMDLAGLDPHDPSHGMDGRSLAPLMFAAGPDEGDPDELELGAGYAPPWRSALLIEQAKDNVSDTSWKAIRTADRVYVEHEPTQEAELYDMVDDPHQLASRQNDPARAEEVAALSERLAGLEDAGGDDLRQAEVALG